MWRFVYSHPHIVQDHVKIECSASQGHSMSVPIVHATPKSILKQTAASSVSSVSPPPSKCLESSPLSECSADEERQRARVRGRSNDTVGIRFHDQAQMMLIPHVDEYTVDERQAYWFEEAEYAQIKQNNKALLDMIMRNLHSLDKYEDHEDYCFRGLESKVCAETSTSSSFLSSLGEKRKRSSRSRRRQNRKESAKAVLAEQGRQYKEQRSLTDWDRIREAYIDVTARCHEEAHSQGLRDAEKASQILS